MFPKLTESMLLMKPLRQANSRPVISYKPRIEPAPPVHAKRVEGYQDVYLLQKQYVAFVLLDDNFQQSPGFTQPESAQRWANQTRQNSDN